MAGSIDLEPEGDNQRGSSDGPEWVGRAWRLWLDGVRNYSELGRMFGRHRTTVKDALVTYSRQRAAELEGGIDPTAEYIDGLARDLRENARLYREAEQESIRLGLLKERHALRKDLAAALGVITERRSLNLGGNIAVDLSGRTDAELDAIIAEDGKGGTGAEGSEAQ